MLVLCLRCLLFLRLLLLLRTLLFPFRPTFLLVPLMVRRRAGMGLCPSTPHLALLTSPPGPGAALNTPGHGGDVPGLLAIAQGSGATRMRRALEVMPPIMAGGLPRPICPRGGHQRCSRSQRHPPRIAADILAIAQGVADTQADLEILRTGVSDITECLENKIRDMWDLVQTEVKSERDHQEHMADAAHERRSFRSRDAGSSFREAELSDERSIHRI